MIDNVVGGTSVDECDPVDLPVAKAILPDGWVSAEVGLVFRRSRLPGEADFIDTASADSFPASDAPTWATGRARWSKPTSETPLAPGEATMDTRYANIATNILIPLDGSDPASRAIDFAVTIGGPAATYTLLHVAPDEPLVRDATDATTGQDLTQSHATAALLAGSERLRAIAPDANQESVLRTGDPARIIVKEATARSASLIAMASRGRESADEQTFGSTVDRVVRTSSVPVLVVRDRAAEILGPRISRIVVPLDGSQRAEQAIPIAGRLARRLGVPVKLVTVVDPKRSFPPALAYEAVQTGAFFQEILAGLQHEFGFMENRVVKTLNRTGVEADAVLLNGPTISAIVDETAPGDLLVMTSHGQGTGRHWLLGSVSEKMIRETRLPIVLLRSRPEPDVTVLAVDESLGLQALANDYR
jgi:nucleotide-binding universal stress UspA family protein